MSHDLRWKDGRWRSTIASRSDPGPSADVELEACLLPLVTWREGFWVGRSLRGRRTRYGGWGPLAGRWTSSPAQAIEMPPDIPVLDAVLLLPLWAICMALEPLRASRSVAIHGHGPLATLAEAVLTWLGRTSAPFGGRGTRISADLLVDTTGEPREWEAALPGLAREGTILTFVPPWRAPCDFNFYPELHRRSLTLLARRWVSNGSTIEPSELQRLAPMVAALSSNQQVIRPLELDTDDDGDRRWAFFRWE